MSEEEARTRLQNLAATNGGAHRVAEFVDQHIGEIYKLGSGNWDERVAQKHVLISLEAALLEDE